jgi:hypothetical protein
VKNAKRDPLAVSSESSRRNRISRSVVLLSRPTPKQQQFDWANQDPLADPPTGTPTTSTGFTNGYVQVGLTDAATSTTSIGHAYTGSNGLFRRSTVTALNNIGQAAGTSSRYISTGGSYGTDAWHDSGNDSSINLNPTAGTVTVVGNGNSNYFYGSTSLNLTRSVLTINSDGLVAGHLNRYTTSGSNVGQDGYVYDPHDNTEYVLTSPSVSSSNDYGKVQIMALSDTDVAVGYYQTTSDGSTLNGTCIFAWTGATGLVALEQINSIDDVGTLTHLGPNDALDGESGWAALANSITTSFTSSSALLALDGSGNIYGLGNTNSSSVATVNGVFEIAAVTKRPFSSRPTSP